MTGRPGYAEGEDPLVTGWPICRLPRVDHGKTTLTSYTGQTIELGGQWREVTYTDCIFEATGDNQSLQGVVQTTVVQENMRGTGIH